MASRRQAFCARRRGSHSQMRQGVVPQQDGGSSQAGGSGKAQKAAKAQKAQKAS